jgi:flavin-binding protein dodecin
MADGSVYIVNEIVGTSNESWEEAARVALNTAAKTLRDLRIAEVVKQDIVIDDDGSIALFRVRLNVSFRYDKD